LADTLIKICILNREKITKNTETIDAPYNIKSY